MVFFTCSNCGESLKKKDVEKHWFRCKFNSISCVDCQKDFTKQTYGSHTTCLTEDQKYQGKLYTEKESANKGQKKQDAWITNIVNYANTGKESKQISGYLHTLSNHTNIPRKKAKFVNFAKSCLKIHDETMITRLWNAIEVANKDFNRSPTKSDDKVSVDSAEVGAEDQTKEKTDEAGPSTSNAESEVAQPSDDKADDANNDSSSEPSKKKKRKKQIEELVEESKDAEGKEEPMDTKDSNVVESQDLNTDLKEKRKKKRKVEEAVVVEPTPEEIPQVDETLVEGSEESSKKKKEKDKKQKSQNEEESKEQVQPDEQKVEEETTEIAEKTDSDKIADEINTETTNGESKKKDKKKKKQKTTDDSTKVDESIPVDTPSTSGPEVENQDVNASQADQRDSDADAGEPSYSKGGKFKWMKAIKNILKEQEDKKISLKKLQKKIFKIYESSCQENEQLTKLSKEDCFAQVEKFVSESGKRKQDRKIRLEDGVVVWKVA